MAAYTEDLVLLRPPNERTRLISHCVERLETPCDHCGLFVKLDDSAIEAEIRALHDR